MNCGIVVGKQVREAGLDIVLLCYAVWKLNLYIWFGYIKNKFIKYDDV